MARVPFQSEGCPITTGLTPDARGYAALADQLAERSHGSAWAYDGPGPTSSGGLGSLLDALEFERKARMKISVDDVVVWFNKIATAAMETGDFTNANRAMENLARYLQMFVERKEITHKVVHNKEELDARIAELTMVLKEAEPDIAARIRPH
mgnify:CR=1 FL=1